MVRLNILDHFVQGCNRETATYEFLAMLFVFAVLGFLLRHLLSNSGNKVARLEEENLNLKLQVSQLEETINDLRLDKAGMEKRWRDQTQFAQSSEQSVYEAKQESSNMSYQQTETESTASDAPESKMEEPPVVLETTESNAWSSAQNETEQNVADEKDEEEERRKEEAHQERIRLERESIMREMEEERIKEQEETRRKLKSIIDSDEINQQEKQHAEEQTTERMVETGQDENKPDDLKMIEGVGPAIERILLGAGINSFKSLSTYTGTQIHEILSQAGSRFKVHDPTTWPEQALLLSEGRIEEFKTFTAQLIAGKKRPE